jgi:hypothetical protein
MASLPSSHSTVIPPRPSTSTGGSPASLSPRARLPSISTTLRDLYIGAQVDPVSGWNYYGNTLLDEMTLYNRMLTAAECRQSTLQAAPEMLRRDSAAARGDPWAARREKVTAGSTVEPSVEAAGTLPIRYQWQFNGTNILDATNSVLRLPNVQISATGKYRVSVSNVVNSVLSRKRF